MSSKGFLAFLIGLLLPFFACGLVHASYSTFNSSPNYDCTSEPDCHGYYWCEGGNNPLYLYRFESKSDPYDTPVKYTDYNNTTGQYYCPPPICEYNYVWELSGDPSSSAGYRCYENVCNNVFVDNSLCSISDHPVFGNSTYDKDYEDGIDCGGISGVSCSESCPYGYEAYYPADSDTMCTAWSDPDQLGQCPQGYKSYSKFYGEPASGGKDCVSFSPDVGWGLGNPYLMSDAFYNEEFELHPEQYTIDPPSAYTGSTDSSTTQTSRETVHDNGDGTETATITRTVTNADGSTSTITTTVKRPSGSSAGTGFSSDGGVSPGYEGSSDQTGTGPVDENPENYNFDQADYGGDQVYDTEIDPSMMPEEEDIPGLLDSFYQSFPLASVLDSYSMTIENTQCEFHSDPVFGQVLTIDMCRWQELLESLGSVFVIVAQASAAFIVINGWKGGSN